MSRKAVSGMLLTLLLIGMLTLAFRIQPVEAEPTTIVVPDDYPKIQEAIDNADEGDTIFVRDGTYCEHVVMNKGVSLVGENKFTTIIDGSGRSVVSLEVNNTRIRGFTVQNGDYGIRMYPWTHGHIISDNIILNNNYGVSGHYDCFDVTICDNTITSNNITGVKMLFSHSMISDNLIFDNGKGEFQEYSSGMQIFKGVDSEVIYCVNNTVSGNTIENHRIGIWAIQYSDGNLFFHNNFINNTRQVHGVISNDTWDEGYPSGGNYWSDYADVDLRRGAYQNETGADGIWDHPYVVDENNQDNYPLVSPYWYWSNPMLEDLNKDMIVDVKDISVAARAFGSYPGHERWNPIADVNQDDIVDIQDISTIARSFGKTH